MVTDLIDDTNQTLDAVNDARGSIQDLQATDARIEQQQQDRNAAGNAFESGLFEGFGDAPAPAPVAAEPEAPVAAPVAAEPAPVPVPVEQHAAPDYMRTSAPEYGGVMGGAASAVAYEQPAMAPMGGTSMTSAPSALNPDSFGHNSSMGGISQSLSTEEIDAIKQQVTELDRKAVAAEDSQRQLMAQAEALRQDAEQAELAAAEKASAAEGKKKKKFGGGKKGAMVRFFFQYTFIRVPAFMILPHRMFVSHAFLLFLPGITEGCRCRTYRGPAKEAGRTSCSGRSQQCTSRSDSGETSGG